MPGEGPVRSRADVDRWLAHLTLHGTKLGLATPRRLMAALGDPQAAFPAIHVAGTNGKGSTCRFLEALLRGAGRTVGCFTSPHLEDFSERIAVNGRPIGDGDLVATAERVRRAAVGLETTPTYFESATALAFLHFAGHPARHPVNAAVVEVGMGGRLDATNVLGPQVSVITNVARDHARYLGDTVAEVAIEKAGIIKPGIPVVTAAGGEALGVIREVAAGAGAPVLVAGRDFALTGTGPLAWDGPGGPLDGIALGLEGAHQRDNAALALAAAGLFLDGGLPPAPIVRRALKETRWAGRLERVAAAAPVLLDCAHNGDAARVLADHLAATAAEGPVWLVLGVLGDKDFTEIARHLVPRARRVLVTAPDSGRRGDPEAQAVVAARLGAHVAVVPGVAAAVDRALAEAPRAGARVVVTGSIYTVGEARAHLRAARAAA